MIKLKELIKSTPFEHIARSLYQCVNGYNHSSSRDYKNRTNALLCCFPKSGSTFISSVISMHPDFRKVSLVPSYGAREQELDKQYLIKARKFNYIAQHHLRCSNETEKLIRQFKLIPIVLVRNIYDVVPSIRDHLRNGSSVGPMGFITEKMVSLSDDDLDVAISHILIPWYFNFYLSWFNYKNNKILIKYEDMQSDPEIFFIRLFEKLGYDLAAEDIAGFIEQALAGKTRLNKGITGRGESIGIEARNHIRKLASYYEGVDFSPIGIID